MKGHFILLIFLAFANCGKLNRPVTGAEQQTSTYSKIFWVDKGWDIYTGGVYRYGPSIIENVDGSIDAWFAAPGDNFGERTLHYIDAGLQTPVSLSPANTAAQKFLATDSFYAVEVACPNWGAARSSITLNLFKWTSDYATTIAAASIADTTYINYVDNQHLQVAKDSKFPPGAYLWMLSDASGTAGVWKKEGEVENGVNYFDGIAVPGSYQSATLFNKSSGAYYWDQASYRRSVDEGKTWTEDKMVLKPTEGTRDQFSVCDPGVVKSGKYYYAGYTSTEDARGVFNHLYMARSVSPSGPWEKWNGSGWGGAPQPVVSFNGDVDAWGAGEPSMVINNDTLFLYYTWTDSNSNETRVATADAGDPAWPAHLLFHGTAVDKTGVAGADHCDVKYRDDEKKYYAIHAASRLTAGSYIVLWESFNGLTFSKLTDIKANLKPYLHNCGWSGDLRGHIDPAKAQFLCYAYGPEWANWKTAWHPIHFAP